LEHPVRDWLVSGCCLYPLDLLHHGALESKTSENPGKLCDIMFAGIWSEYFDK